MNFKYSLEKGSRKYSCPKCGDKRSFTRYINNSTGEYLGDTIGRCDHEISCKYHLSPKQAGIDNLPSSEFLSGLPQKKRTTYISLETFKSTFKSYRRNNFTKGLLNRFSKDTVTHLIEHYFIGTISNDVVFWQVDQFMRIRSGKIMRYDPFTLKRQKDYFDWTHTYFKLKNFNLKQCLFGLHQIQGLDPGAYINIVESEKTAVLMSGFYPGTIWMATSGINGLNENTISPLRNYNVYLYPDIGAEIKWKKKTTGLSNISIIDWVKVLGIEPKDHKRADLADFPHPDDRLPLL